MRLELVQATIVRIQGPGITLEVRGREPGVRGETTLRGVRTRGSVAPDRIEHLALEWQGDSALVLRWTTGGAPQMTTVEADTWFVHRDLGAEIAAVVPPRPAPAWRRIAWDWLPSIVANPIGRSLLRAVRGGGS
jgi:hypothetical protein